MSSSENFGVKGAPANEASSSSISGATVSTRIHPGVFLNTTHISENVVQRAVREGGNSGVQGSQGGENLVSTHVRGGGGKSFLSRTCSFLAQAPKNPDLVPSGHVYADRKLRQAWRPLPADADTGSEGGLANHADR